MLLFSLFSLGAVVSADMDSCTKATALVTYNAMFDGKPTHKTCVQPGEQGTGDFWVYECHYAGVESGQEEECAKGCKALCNEKEQCNYWTGNEENGCYLFGECTRSETTNIGRIGEDGQFVTSGLKTWSKVCTDCADKAATKDKAMESILALTSETSPASVACEKHFGRPAGSAPNHADFCECAMEMAKLDLSPKSSGASPVFGCPSTDEEDEKRAGHFEGAPEGMTVSEFAVFAAGSDECAVAVVCADQGAKKDAVMETIAAQTSETSPASVACEKHLGRPAGSAANLADFCACAMELAKLDLSQTSGASLAFQCKSSDEAEMQRAENFKDAPEGLSVGDFAMFAAASKECAVATGLPAPKPAMDTGTCTITYNAMFDGKPTHKTCVQPGEQGTGDFWVYECHYKGMDSGQEEECAKGCKILCNEMEQCNYWTGNQENGCYLFGECTRSETNNIGRIGEDGHYVTTGLKTWEKTCAPSPAPSMGCGPENFKEFGHYMEKEFKTCGMPEGDEFWALEECTGSIDCFKSCPAKCEAEPKCNYMNRAGRSCRMFEKCEGEMATAQKARTFVKVCFGSGKECEASDKSNAVLEAIAAQTSETSPAYEKCKKHIDRPDRSVIVHEDFCECAMELAKLDLSSEANPVFGCESSDEAQEKRAGYFTDAPKMTVAEFTQFAASSEECAAEPGCGADKFKEFVIFMEKQKKTCGMPEGDEFWALEECTGSVDCFKSCPEKCENEPKCNYMNRAGRSCRMFEKCEGEMATKGNARTFMKTCFGA